MNVSASLVLHCLVRYNPCENYDKNEAESVSQAHRAGPSLPFFAYAVMGDGDDMLSYVRPEEVVSIEELK